MVMEPSPLEAYVTPQDLAARLAVSTRALENMRRTGRGPAFVRLPGCVRYPLAGVYEWLESRRA